MNTLFCRFASRSLIPGLKFLFLTLPFGAMNAPVFAATLTVPGQYATIQAAVTAAANNDTVLVAAGTYSGPGNRDIDFGGKNLTVASTAGAASTIIDCGGYASTDGSGNHRGFFLHQGETAVIISGLTIKNGYETYVSTIMDSGFGGGIENGSSNGGTLTLTRCIFSNNTVIPGNDGSAGDGGAIDNYNGDGSGTIALTNCILTGNSAQNGGGIENDNDDGGTITLTNCIVSDNTAQYYGGGIDNGGPLDLTNCTLTGNNAPDGGGGIDNDNGSANLTNCILYADISSEITNLSTFTATFCDIQGGYTGNGNIDADPMFVNAVGGDLHVKSGSPCLGAGTASGAPATDLDSNTRPNPPSIGAYDRTGAAAAPGTTHVLWNNANTASIWNYNTTNGTFTQNTYGPYANWTAKAVADGGTDDQTRVLWVNVNGTASIWSLNNATGMFSQYTFGPYGGWTANAVSVGPDNTTHILWDNANTASIWNYNTTNGTFTQNTYGPYAGWTAKSIADGPDGQMRVLWDNTNGAASIWSLNNNIGTFSQFTFGPYAGWKAAGVSVGTDNTTHILWNNTSGAASVWNYNTSAGTFTQNTYGPYANWAANGIADGPDGKMRVLWDNTDGRASLWSLDNAAGIFSQYTFGPYGGWAAAGISAGT